MEAMIQDDCSLKQRLEDELLKDEKILWAGQPDPSVHLAKADIFLIPFSLLWGGMAVATSSNGLIAAVQHPRIAARHWFSVAFDLAFLSVAFFLTIGRFINKAWRKRRTHYAVTDKRVLIVTETRGRAIDAAYIRDIAAVNRQGRPGRVGTVVFGSAALSIDNVGLSLGPGQGSGAPTFYDIKDADHVYELVNRLRNEV